MRFPLVDSTVPILRGYGRILVEVFLVFGAFGWLVMPFFGY